MAPPEVQPLAVLMSLAHKHAARAELAENEAFIASQSDDDGVPDGDDGQAEPSQEQLSLHRQTKRMTKRITKFGQFAMMGKAVLVAREQKRRANKAFARAKQLWIWTAALGFSYVDLVGTVFVGMEYWAIGGDAGRQAARVTFGMLAGSLGLQSFHTYASGIEDISCPYKTLKEYRNCPTKVIIPI